jgi:hypothetical protein
MFTIKERGYSPGFVPVKKAYNMEWVKMVVANNGFPCIQYSHWDTLVVVLKYYCRPPGE